MAALPVYGSSVIEAWLIHLAGLGYKQIVIHANDRIEAIRSIVGKGCRWGLGIEIKTVPPAQIESMVGDIESGITSHQTETISFVQVLNHFPRQAGHNIFASYAHWFRAVQDRLPQALTPDRVGIKEVRPGIFAGSQSWIPDSAQLTAPCWIGHQVVIGPATFIGPQTVIEDRAVVKKGARIKGSIIGPDTLVGRHTEINDSLVFGDLLINWKSGSSIRVRDVFLLSSLRSSSFEQNPSSSVANPLPGVEKVEEYLEQNSYRPVSPDKSLSI